MRNFYYNLDANKKVVPSDPDQLSVNFKNEEMRRVGFDDIGPFNISTVFLFMNVQFHTAGPPVVFETMVFQKAIEISAELEDVFCLFNRYCTYDEAVKGHKEICNEVRRMYWSAANSGR